MGSVETSDSSAGPLLADSVERRRTAAAVMQGLFGDAGEQLLAGRFRLIELLGAGSMGSVYLAEDIELGRHVAVKRLSSATPGDEHGEQTQRRRARMVREARALARVSHPNVVVVHDVRTEGRDVFVAMEFVPGQTIHRWLEGEPTLTAILDVFTQAARGLAAAHAVGLVHRDFKPANVLVGSDGRVRVVDFGLAATDDAEPPSEPSSAEEEATASPRLTATGAIIGTPSYMAPEQLARGVADARSDQFAFCVSLWEAVHGKRPFDGRDERELLAAMQRGVPRPANTVPRWLTGVLERGLQLDPEARFDGLEAIIRVIDPVRRRRARWRRTLVGGGLTTLVLVGAAARATAPAATEAAEPCPRRPLDETVWGAARADAVESRIKEVSNAAYADALAPAVRGQLDAYADQWAEGRRLACVDTYVDRVQSEALFDLRMRCLQRKAAQLDALVGRLTTADAELAMRMPATVAALPSVAECSDRARLTAAYARPPEVSDAAVVGEVEALHDRASAAIVAGAHDDARATLDAAREQMAAVQWPVMDAQLAFAAGKLLAADEQIERAERAFLDAAAAAEASSADRIAAQVWIHLVWHATTKRKDPERAEFYLERARAAVTRVGTPADLEALLQQRTAGHAMTRGDYDRAIAVLSEAKALLSAAQDRLPIASMEIDLGRAFYSKGDYAGAVERFAAAQGLFEAAYGAGHPRVASVLSNRGSAELMAGRRDDASEHLSTAYAAQRRIYGDDHPRLARTLNSLASIDYVEGRFEDALVQYRKVLAIFEAAKGPEHKDLADPLANIGRTLARLGRYDEALPPSQRAVEILEAARGPDHPDVATALTGLGGVQGGAGLLPAALASHRRALEIREAAFGSDSAKAAESGVTVADVYRRLERPRLARKTVERWLPVMRNELGPAHPHTAPAEVTLGWLELDQGNLERAATAFRRADEGLADDTPSTRLMLELGLAITTWDEDPALARRRLQRVIASGTDPRFAQLAAQAQLALDEHDGDPAPDGR